MNCGAQIYERGSATTEVVLLTPAVILMLLFVVALGRIGSSRAEVDSAARDAARDAANARSIAQAVAFGDRAARGDLNASGVTCGSVSVVVDTHNFRAGGTVTATVSCTVAFADLVGLDLPATKTITARYTEPIDTYRAVS
ncbi:MAG TPA: TadE/TadG family type IV pilus assembly protein [Acidimicrobiia bacterium]|nr:TadE/TadG family type IV pilus assembly protein [Acidimicrobiia bacterium]